MTIQTDEEILDWYDKEVSYPFKLGVNDKGSWGCFDPKTNRERLLTIHKNLVKDYKTLKNGLPKLSKCGLPICDEDKITDFMIPYHYECERNIYSFRIQEQSKGMEEYYGRKKVFGYIPVEDRRPFDKNKYLCLTQWYNRTDICFDSLFWSFQLIVKK